MLLLGGRGIAHAKATPLLRVKLEEIAYGSPASDEDDSEAQEDLGSE